MVNVLEMFAEAFVDFVYPPSCTTCARMLGRGERYICGRCWDNFERVVRTESIIQNMEQKFINDESLDGIDSLFLFGEDQRVRTAVHILKYNGAEAVAANFAALLARKIAAGDLIPACDSVVPVPLHPARQRERGYNQSELISSRVAAALGMSHEPRLLKRTRQTQTQTLLDAERRKSNISGAFEVDRDLLVTLKGKRILIIDDVITTGSTIKECARTLKRGGATSVYAASAAITV